METHKNKIRNFVSVIPAKVGIQAILSFFKENLDSRFRGNDKQEKKFPKKVMVFGVFDRLHPGHISFLEQAAQWGNELIVVITRDDVVNQLKKKMPMDGERIRKEEVRKIAHADKAIMGDAILGSYDVIHHHKPDIICLGYDQHGLREDLQFRMDQGEIAQIEIAIMEPHEADRFHTSLLTYIK